VRDTTFGGIREKESIFPDFKVPRQCPLVLPEEAAHIIGITCFLLFLIKCQKGCIMVKFELTLGGQH
jgi:hypothetical protein